MNQKLFLIINSFANKNPILDKVGISISEYTPYIFILIEIYFYFVAKKKNESIFAFNSMLIALFLSKLIGKFYIHNRPSVDKIGTTLVKHKPDGSFPSDHTTFIFALAITLFIFNKNKLVGSLLILLAFLGGIGRIFVGVHYPFDIIGAIILAIFSSTIIYIFRKKLQFINDFIFKIENMFLGKK